MANILNRPVALQALCLIGCVFTLCVGRLETLPLRAAGPSDDSASVDPSGAERHQDWRQAAVSKDAANWWAFRPLSGVVAPEITSKSPETPEYRTAVDRFVISRQLAAGITMNAPADRRVLCRRLFLVITGIPPSPRELREFVDDNSADAYERLVDRLLVSQHFGERWARHWLDVARFAESFGFEQDYDRPHAYHYRDFVIRAFNDDMPFDQFVRWQLAGDELAPDDPQAWMATGFLGAGAFPTQLTEAEFESARYDELDDMASTTGMAFLGLSIGCARCHDHKFDPIPQADYYRFATTFTAAIRSNRAFDFRNDEEKAKAALFEEARTALLAELAAAKGTPRESELEKLVKDHEKLRPSGMTKVMVVSEGVKPIPHHADGRGFPHFYPQTFFLVRGEVAKQDGVAEQGFLQVLMRGVEGPGRWQSPPPEDSASSHRRAALARWITDVEHGSGHLVARVIVNRLWHHYFGRGIVSTPSDFGRQGAPPTYAELLDWLAAELIRNGWRLKPIHRLLATSAVFMQSSAGDVTNAAIDPDNTLLWQFSVRRLEGEAIRDQMLSVSGLLDSKMFGPGTLDESTPRRSIYLFVKRSKPIPSMQLFDSPEPLVSQGRRPTTTTGPGALWFLNNENVRRCAEGLADRTMTAKAEKPTALIRRGYLLALCREPTEFEMADAKEYIVQQTASYERTTTTSEAAANARRLALVDLAQVLLSLNEFIYLE